MFIVKKKDASALHQAAGQGNIDELKLLIEQGADVDEQTQFGRTPLSIASWHKQVSAVEILLEEGASVNVMDNPGLTPLHLVFSPIGGPSDCETIVDLLTAHGAEVNAQTNKGETPVFFACRQGELKSIRKLVSLGADLYLTPESGETCLDVAKIYRQAETVQYLVSDHSFSRRDPSLTTPAGHDNAMGGGPKRPMPLRIDPTGSVMSDDSEPWSPDLVSEQENFSYADTEDTSVPEISLDNDPTSPDLESEMDAQMRKGSALDSYQLFNDIVKEQFNGHMTQEDELLLTELLEMGFDATGGGPKKVSTTQEESVESDGESDEDDETSVAPAEVSAPLLPSTAASPMSQLETDLLRQENEKLKETLAHYQQLVEDLKNTT